MNHKELTERAHKWLYRNQRCKLVLVEPNGAGGERPDAIGFTRYNSIVVEAKSSRRDFQRDQHKPSRRVPFLGLGMYRWYIVPAKMIAGDEIPKGWGLLWAYPTQTRKIVEAVKKEHSTTSLLRERNLLLASYVSRYYEMVDKYYVEDWEQTKLAFTEVLTGEAGTLDILIDQD